MKTGPAIMLLGLLLLPFCLTSISAADSDSSARSLADFRLPSDFFDNKCDRCISRTESVVQVLVASSSKSNPDWTSTKSTNAGSSPEEWDYIQSAMEQASRDTQIRLEFSVYEDNNSSATQAMAADIRQLASEKLVHALIVALPSSTSMASVVEEAVSEALGTGMPVFGFGAGYQTAPDVGFLGFVAQDAFMAGELVGRELLGRLDLSGDQNATEDAPINALFITGFDTEDSKVKDRFRGIQSSFDEAMDSQVEWTSAALKMETANTAALSSRDASFAQLPPEEIFKECLYDVIVADGDVTAEVILLALEESKELHGCTTTNILFATFGVSPNIHSAILKRTVAFAAVPQLYLQSVFAVMMASVFVTTGKKLALPIESNNVYLSGPSIYALDNLDRLPENTITKCKELAFPVCDSESSSGGLKPFDSPILSNALAEPATRTCNAQGCLNRKDIRISGVLHGTTTSNFWKPIYASAHKVAEDLGITLEMGPEEPTQNPELMWKQMGLAINKTCESGIDGLIVTIPDRALFPAIRYCQSLDIPILSINSGAEFSEELGLMVHIGQMEYNAGYGAGERLIGEGMKDGYCLIHNLENVALQDRCKGFEDAIAEHDDVTYHGLIFVSGDDTARSVNAVELAFQSVGHTSFESVAMLACSQSLIEAVMEINAKHPGVMAATFDYGEDLYGPLADGRLKFAIDQQPLLQGMIPVYLLAYAADTKQRIVNPVVETGPHFADAPPSADQQICEGHHYRTCAAIPKEDMNKLPRGLVAIGYFMVALTLTTALFCVVWTKYYWGKSELVHVSQPPFLFTLALGIVVSTLSIVFMSVEADYPTVVSTVTGRLTGEPSSNISAVNASCMAVPWLHSIGSVIVFASLFGKIWKIKLIYQAGARFRRVTVGLKDVLPYAMMLLAVVVSLLTAWQIADPFVWIREVELQNSEGLALESYGSCTSDTGWYYWIALLSFQLGYLIYALVLCWQTRAIPSSFAESSHVSLCVVCIFQVSVLAIPITAMVREDTTAYYFVRACAVFLQNFTVLVLIFGPKMWLVYKGEDKLVIRTSSVGRGSVTSGRRSSNSNRKYQQNFDESPEAMGNPRIDLRSENAELKLHILDLEAVGKGSLLPTPEETPKSDVASIKENSRTETQTEEHTGREGNADNPTEES